MIETIKIVSDIARECVHKIAEDEVIRTTQKSIKEFVETETLQRMINNAVAKGDTETAQTLLKILDKRHDQ